VRTKCADVRYEMWDVRCEMWDVRCADVRYEMWDVRCEMWDVRLRVWAGLACGGVVLTTSYTLISACSAGFPEWSGQAVPTDDIYINFVISTAVGGRNYLLSAAKNYLSTAGRNLMHLTIPPAKSAWMAYKISPTSRWQKFFMSFPPSEFSNFTTRHDGPADSLQLSERFITIFSIVHRGAYSAWTWVIGRRRTKNLKTKKSRRL